MDKNLVNSIESATDLSTKVKPQSVLMIKKELILLTYFLQVRKSYFITVTIFRRLNLMQWLIYDGPLFQSSIINAGTSNANTIKLSSFRCLLQVLLKEHDFSMVFRYNSIRIHVNLGVYLDRYDHILVSLPNAECSINNNLCALNVFAKYDNQVNVSVVKMAYKGIESEMCKYAGLVATQHLGVNDYKETVALCESFDGNFSQRRHFFSYNSSMSIVLYWYGHEDIIDATVSLSVTKCQPVEICPCTYYQLCIMEREHHTACNAYLRKQMQFSNVNLEIGIVKVSLWSHRELHFSVKENECFVMQILRNTSRFFKGQSNCIIDIAPKPIFVTNEELNYHFVGSTRRSPVVDSKCFTQSCIWFKGTADQFCIDKINDMGNLNCKIAANEVRNDRFYSIFSKPLSRMGKDTNFVVYAKSRIPTYFNVFNINLFSHVLVNMWMDITVFRNFQMFKENRLGTNYALESIQMKSRGLLMEATKFSGVAGQVIMLKFDSKKAMLLRRLKYPIGAYVKTMFPHHTVLKWNSTAMQSRSGGIYLIAVPGQTTEVSIFKVRMIRSRLHASHIKRTLNDMSISVAYVYDNYEKYSHLTSQNMSKCDKILKASLQGFGCLNMSTPTHSSFHYILFKKSMTHDYSSSSNQRQYPSDRHLSSWTQASESCRKAGAYLPYFTNREDLEELLALLKLSPDIPPVEAIFIGLKFNGSGMVRNW